MNNRRRRDVQEIIITTSHWTPLPVQEDFLFSAAKWRWFLGGYGSGKTAALGVDTLRKCIVNAGRQGMLIAPTYSVLNSTTLPAFMELVPKDAIRYINHTKRFADLINGTRLFWGSSDNPKGLEGKNLSFAALDEAPLVSAEAWRIIKGRVRVPAPYLGIAGVGTPEAGWIEDAIREPKSAVFHSSSRDNHHNDEDYVAGLESSYSKADAARLIDGHFIRAEGLVYNDWSHEENVLRDYTFEHGRDELRCSIDFGYRFPAALWIARFERNGEWYDVVIDEEVPNDKSAKEMANIIKRKNHLNDYYPIEYFGDSAGGSIRDDGRTTIADYRDEGVDVITDKKWKDINAGVSIFRGRIKSVSGERRFYCTGDMQDRYEAYPKVERGFCKDITHYKYPKVDSAESAKDKPSNKANKRSEHTMDAARYYNSALYRHSSMVSGDFTHRNNAAVENNAWDAYGEEIAEANIVIPNDYGPGFTEQF